MDQSDTEENFYGVYLLKNLNIKSRGSTYIGFTVNPNRRIKQHNRGKEYGGAWRTSNRGPWEMVLIVHGFPSEISALRFEWAWQHPKKSRRLKGIITNKKSSETCFEYKVRIMFTMLSTPPWNRLPLTIRWLSADVVVDAPPLLTPPTHMPIRYGSVVLKKNNGKKTGDECSNASSFKDCKLCGSFDSEENLLTCLNNVCKSTWHIFCLASKFLDEELNYSANHKNNPSNGKKRKRIVPVEGSCPDCKSFLLWGDVIKKKKTLNFL